MRLTRRDFLAASACLPVLNAADQPQATQLAPTGEPGIPILIEGVVYQSDGKTPAAGARIFAYQTDAKGIYGPAGEKNKERARIKGFIQADAQGRYSFATIRPASYPNTTIQAHIHVHAAPAGASDADVMSDRNIVPDYLFDDDPRLAPAEREKSKAKPARFGHVLRFSKGPGGFATAQRDLRIGDRP